MGISPQVASFVAETEAELGAIFAKADETAAVNQLKILNAMQKARLSDSHFNDSTGYGYHDEGREVLETVFANIFQAEAALVRPQLISGTHALATALFGNLRPNDVLFSPVGKPYDTLESVIGIRGASGSLAEFGVKYLQAELKENGDFDYDAINAILDTKPKMVTIQRSKGYSWRKSFTPDEINELIKCIRSRSAHTIILVDNCYGEFVAEEEPIAADILAGSLIKNPGGGIAPGGGYVVGKKKYVEAAAERLTAPGLGSAVGPSLGLSRTLLQGLFLAPQTVSAAVKGAVLAAAVFERLGFEIAPSVSAPRSDIVQAIKLGTPENVQAFCRGIQKAAPVDSFVTPVPAPMPGYAHGVIMAGGTFVQGSSIELSADAPMREPYIVYFQGGLTEAHSRAGVVFAAEELFKIKTLGEGNFEKFPSPKPPSL
ncbi:MAG: methionine gamma-lyase family protein, partial [Defluviitaleaceae bacterium]|nr:methionine gamma-lyase family protein [Defluviitaleaceae bacterium]